ncbi:SMK killer toxin resistance protein [Saxophila tyrrhenica]|uniref:SMK killer toxin resistance protein n=1 Tax=Saxophila tyrrhenica TaxID=1690608 RepID=A0AAV9PI91_9PEZI|nr:SMK killer toxin resistance protein [Saxophila tyrrhenica]
MNSILTPGPTPPLLLATNITFAALQLLLFVLLIATYSYHFAILSVLCGGLWWSINWFATELRAAQVKEEEAEALRKRERREKGKGWKEKGEVEDSADDEGESTEVEEEGQGTGEVMAGSGGRHGGVVVTGLEQGEARQRRVEEDGSGDEGDR